MLKTNPSANIKFLMVGKDCDHDNAELMGWINEHEQLKDKIVLLGNRDDVPVCPCRYGYFLSAFADRVFSPVFRGSHGDGLALCFNRRGRCRLSRRRKCTPRSTANEEALANALLKVIAFSKQERDAMGSRGKTRVLAEFDIDKVGDRYNQVYRELLAESPC